MDHRNKIEEKTLKYSMKGVILFFEKPSGRI
jgi:hypothetical protein